MIITNAFSVNMLTETTKVNFEQITIEAASSLVKNNAIMSAIGHADTANVVGGILGIDLYANRVNVRLSDKILVAQYTGPRLPEGATTLPEGATITFWLVSKC